MTTYTKLGADGQPTEGEHHAVRVEHPLLAQPISDRLPCAGGDDLEAGAEVGRGPRYPLVGPGACRPSMRPRSSPIGRSIRQSTSCSSRTSKGDQWIWTSTPDAEAPSDCAWIVYLHSGYVIRGGQTIHYSVRAVRAGE